MPYRLAPSGSREVLLISHLGPATASALRQTIDEVAPDRTWCSGMATVWDLRHADLSTFAIDEMREFGVILGNFECRRGSRAALVYREPAGEAAAETLACRGKRFPGTGSALV